jgi:hypothetical protein
MRDTLLAAPDDRRRLVTIWQRCPAVCYFLHQVGVIPINKRLHGRRLLFKSLQVLEQTLFVVQLNRFTIGRWDCCWGYPDSVDSDQGLAVVSVRAVMSCCS